MIVLCANVYYLYLSNERPCSETTGETAPPNADFRKALFAPICGCGPFHPSRGDGKENLPAD